MITDIERKAIVDLGEVSQDFFAGALLVTLNRIEVARSTSITKELNIFTLSDIVETAFMDAAEYYGEAPKE